MSNINTATSNIPIPDNAYSQWYKSRMLARHTAWRITSDKVTIANHAHQHQRDIEAVVMLAYVAAAYKFHDELATELTEAGLYRHEVKRAVNMIDPILSKASNAAINILKRVNNGKANAGYFNCMDSTYDAVDKCVSLSPPERAYNILIAMCRLAGKYAKKLTEYRHLRQMEAVKVVKILERIPIHDYKMDNIIELTVKPLIFNREY